MIKRTTSVYTKKEIQELIDKEEVVRILYNNFITVTMIIKRRIIKHYSNSQQSLKLSDTTIIGRTSHNDSNGIDKYSISIDRINIIEVLDEVHALIWKLENHF